MARLPHMRHFQRGRGGGKNRDAFHRNLPSLRRERRKKRWEPVPGFPLNKIMGFCGNLLVEGNAISMPSKPCRGSQRRRPSPPPPPPPPPKGGGGGGGGGPPPHGRCREERPDRFLWRSGPAQHLAGSMHSYSQSTRQARFVAVEAGTVCSPSRSLGGAGGGGASFRDTLAACSASS